jgi:hypothetical protein
VTHAFHPPSPLCEGRLLRKVGVGLAGAPVKQFEGEEKNNLSFKLDDVLHWTASPNRSDAVQHKSDVDGRVRQVIFILGQVARDNFLRAMKR